MLTVENRKRIENRIKEIDNYLSGIGIEFYPDKRKVSIAALEREKQELIDELQYDNYEKNNDRDLEIT